MRERKGIQVVNPDDIEKENMKKLVTFRTDPTTYSKIVTLEKTMEKSKSNVIKDAIIKSYDNLIFVHFNSMIFDIMQDIFKNIEMIDCSFTMRTQTFDDEDTSNKNPFKIMYSNCENTSIAQYKAKRDTFSTPDKNVVFNLSNFLVEVNNKPSDTVSIKFTISKYIEGDIKKISSEVYFEIIEMITKRKFKIETLSKEGKIFSNIFFEVEGSARTSKTGINIFKKIMNDINNMIEEIEEFLKNRKDIIRKKVRESQSDGKPGKHSTDR
jgi:hypothetical protein